MMSRAYTADEVQTMFLDHVRGIAKYWATVPNQTVEERTAGCAFSLLVLLDGESAALPGFTVTPNPHPDDQAYHTSIGEPYFPSDVDIAGTLHERFHQR